ncbi:MAG: cytochrome c biogenesis protein DipZ [Patescibacteria group bacterium]
MTLLILFAFLAGLVTIFAPCIWPILPIVLSAGASGGEKKPLGIVVGLAVSFMLIILALASLVKVIPFDPEALRTLAVFIIGFLGLTMIIPALGARLEAAVSRLSGLGGRFTHNSGTGFGSGFIVGFALGIVWSPCAGPILATIATLAATQAVSFQVVLITFAFVVGVALPLFILAVLGQKVLVKTSFFSRYTKRIQQVFGAIMILAALAIYTGYDRTLQTKILDSFPGYGNFLYQFEKNDAVKQKLDELKGAGREGAFRDTKTIAQAAKSGLANYGPAPEFTGIVNWLNTDTPLTLESLRGKVVLVDFWTYSCINCIRTLPYLTSWYEKYKDQGFVIVGVHTPEFEFEKKTSNVVEAMKRYKINYPVAQDNDYATWQAYSNRYWPAHYLIDAEGNVRQYHFGEGKYEETEKAIQELLKEAGQKVTADISNVETEESSGRQTPETYLGSARMERFVSPEAVTDGEQPFMAPENIRDIPKNSFAYAGIWKVEAERAIALADAKLVMRFEGKKVFLVMAPAVSGQSSTVSVFLDGERVAAALAGNDVTDGAVTVDADRLYELIDMRGVTGEHTLELRFEGSGTAAYAFTFGN